MDYEKVLAQALERVLEDYETGRIHLESEGDFRGHLFHRCVEILNERGHPPPVPVHAERSIAGGRPDIVIGPDSDTVVELKFEPYRSEEGSLFIKVSGGSHSIERDIQKLDLYAKIGKTAHLVIIEAQNRSYPYYFPTRTGALGIPPEKWHKRRGFYWVDYRRRIGSDCGPGNPRE